MEGSAVKVKLKQGAHFHNKLCEQLISTKGWWGSIYIHNGLWRQIGMPEFCNQIEEWHVRRSLQLYKNGATLIIHEISHIHFPSLLYLSLEGNSIESVEKLARLSAPRLQQLCLGSNRITQIGSLKKCVFPCLEALNLSGNMIAQLGSLSMLQSKQLYALFLEYESDQDWCCDCRVPVVKLQSISNNKFKCLGVWSKRRIAQNTVYHSFKQIHKEMVIQKSVK